MKELKIYCACGKGFSPTAKMMIEHREPDGLIELFYVCPYCKAKHQVCYMNDEIKKIQKLIDKARNQGNAEACRILCGKKKMLMDELNNRL